METAAYYARLVHTDQVNRSRSVRKTRKKHIMPTAPEHLPPSPLIWQPTAATPLLEPGGLHLWRLPQAGAADEEPALAVLSLPERRRAEAIRNPLVYRSYIHNRANMRRILSAYLDLHPGLLELGNGLKGKPYVSVPTTDLRFNLSHSGGLALLAVLRGKEIGLDVECVRPRQGLEAIARRMFDRQTASALLDLPPQERIHGFHREWTRLEAGVKALGDGLFDPRQGVEDMCFSHFVPQPGYLACVAMPGEAPEPGDWLNLDYR